MHRSIKFDEDTYGLLEEIAKSERRSTASLIRNLLANHPAVVGYRIFKEKGYLREVDTGHDVTPIVGSSRRPSKAVFKSPHISVDGEETLS